MQISLLPIRGNSGRGRYLSGFLRIREEKNDFLL